MTSATASTPSRLLNPGTYDPAEFDPATRRLLRATIDWFEAKGKASLTAEVRTDVWYADFIAFLARERAFATLLTPARDAGGDPDKRWDTARNAAFNEILGFYGLSYGRVDISLATRPDFANPLGTVHGGIAATLLDSVMGCAVQTTLPAGVGYTTLELKVNYIRAVRTDGQTLTATGTVIHAGRRTATAEGKVLDKDGKLIAHATTTCIVLQAAG